MANVRDEISPALAGRLAAELALDLARRWLPRSNGAAWAVRRGLRTLIKRGDVHALELLGVAHGAGIRLTALTTDHAVAIGETVAFTLTLELDGTADADTMIDYRVHFVGAHGLRRPKVFKLTRRRLEPGRPTTITRQHRFEHVSIRRIHPGLHTIDVQVNGRILGTIDVNVVDGAGDVARR